MKFFVHAMLREQDARVRQLRGGEDGCRRRGWFGLAPKFLGTLPTVTPAWARVAQPERIAEERTLIKDDTDEDLPKIFEQEAHQDRCCDSDRLQHAAGSVGLWDTQAP